jgi:hypothetical protein
VVRRFAAEYLQDARNFQPVTNASVVDYLEGRVDTESVPGVTKKKHPSEWVFLPHIGYTGHSMRRPNVPTVLVYLTPSARVENELDVDTIFS